MDLLSQVEGRKAGSISNRELAVIESQALSAPRERPCGEASLTLVVLSSRHLFFMAPQFSFQADRRYYIMVGIESRGYSLCFKKHGEPLSFVKLFSKERQLTHY